MKKLTALFMAILMVLSFAACGASGGTAKEEAAAADDYVAPEYTIPDEYALVNGEPTLSDSAVSLSDEEIQKIKDGNFKIGIALHYGGNDFATGLVKGIQSVCDELGVEVCAVTDATFNPVQQAADIENIMALSPDAMIVLPVDGQVMAESMKKVSEAGINLVIAEADPTYLDANDYVAYVNADAYANGVASGMAMADALGGQGQVAVFYFEDTGDGMVNRHKGFMDYLEACTDIEVVQMQGFTDTNEVAAMAEAVFARYPNLDGAWASWDVPAEGIISAAKAQGMKDSFAVTSIDLGVNVARIMAEDGMMKGVGAQRPYFDGRTQAMLALKSLIGSEIPKYIRMEALQVTRDNLVEAWPMIYNEELPEEIANILK